MPEELASLWYDLVPTLALTGVGKLLAEHALPLRNQPNDFHLVLDAHHDMLLADNQVRVVERALAERLGTSVQLRISTAVLRQETPAARAERLRQQRLQAAQAAIASDPTVKQLLQEFGGQVQIVKPLDD
ncbi:MAG: DNA polymerase III subunit gamma/tau C-terminal domain-containing protein [Pseudomonadales bacterium]